MKRSFWISFAVFLLLVIVPHFVQAQTTFQTIIPLIHSGNACDCAGQGTPSAPDWGCVLQTIQAGLEDVVVLATVLITVFIAWAGVSFMASPTSAEARSKARQRLVNAVLGLIIVLAAFLLVNSILGVIYNASAVLPGTQGVTVGAWNSLLSDSNPADDCVTAITTRQNLPGLSPGNNTLGSTGTTPAAPAVAGPISATGDCSAASLTQTWGSQALGNTFACIVNNESRCQNVLTRAPSQIPGKGSSAGGRYQVLATSGTQGQSQLGIQPACVAIDHGINCDLYYHNGSGDGSANAQLCQQALLDPTCNTQVAMYLYKNGGFRPWTGAGDVGGKNQACVNTYDH